MKALEPFRIGTLKLKNRLVVSAMVTNYCNPDGTPTEKFLAYHEHKAKGGWGPGGSMPPEARLWLKSTTPAGKPAAPSPVCSRWPLPHCGSPPCRKPLGN